MNPGKLYIKIALTFLGVLFATLIAVFAFFSVYPGKHFTSQVEADTKTKVLIIREILEDKIRSSPTKDLFENDAQKDFIFLFGEILEAKVWLQQSDGTLSLKSFPGAIPSGLEKLKRWSKYRNYGSFELYFHGPTGYYAIVPISFTDGKTGSLHILFDRPGPPSPIRGFAAGLFIIALIITPLIIPISRFVVRPLKKLSESALRIAGGDLSHRVDIVSKDEIGRLCQSFNYMADKLESMIRSGKELTANVSHELRSPLTRIRVAEEMLREKLEKGDVKDWGRHLDEIREDILELDTLIGRILELSKMDIQETPLAFTLFDLSDTIRGLLKKLQPVIEQKALKVTADLSFQPSFMGDEEAIRTALLNILDNAVKFTPEKGEIMIQMGSGPEMLHLSITNTHEAIPEQELSSIFDPFHRAKKAKATGSGLGLAITKKIVERHGGTIEARNAEKGLEIRIILPINI